MTVSCLPDDRDKLGEAFRALHSLVGVSSHSAAMERASELQAKLNESESTPIVETNKSDASILQFDTHQHAVTPGGPDEAHMPSAAVLSKIVNVALSA